MNLLYGLRHFLKITVADKGETQNVVSTFFSTALLTLFVVGSLLNAGRSSAEPASGAIDACACPTIQCEPCHVEKGLSFYSEKCGEKNDRIRSCKKMACVPFTEDQSAFKACLSKNGMSKTSSPVTRDSSAWNAKVREVEGQSHALRKLSVANQPDQFQLSRGDLLDSGDKVFTGPNATVKIDFKDGSSAVVAASSELVIEKAEATQVSRSIKLNLLKGKVKSTVAKDPAAQSVSALRKPTDAGADSDKSNLAEPTYLVRTPTAVAGVRGTVFTAEYTVDDLGARTTVRTEEGLVQLNSGWEYSEEPPVFVQAGFRAEHRVPTKSDGNFEFSDESFTKPMPFFETSQKPDPHSARGLASVTAKSIPNDQQIAKQASTISDQSIVCSKPAGAFNQCSYSCETPNGEKFKTKGAMTSCPVRSGEAVCVRRTCMANGKWELPARQPASESSRCKSAEPVVSSCETYW